MILRMYYTVYVYSTVYSIILLCTVVGIFFLQYISTVQYSVYNSSTKSAAYYTVLAAVPWCTKQQYTRLQRTEYSNGSTQYIITVRIYDYTVYSDGAAAGYYDTGMTSYSIKK